MSDRKQKERRSRSPVTIAAAKPAAPKPVAVKVDENAINKPLTDVFSVDREKVRLLLFR